MILSEHKQETPKHYLRCSVMGRKILHEAEFQIGFFDFPCHDAIDALNLNFYEASCLKYLWRLEESNKSSITEDFKKAIHCAELAVNRNTKWQFIRNIFELKDCQMIVTIDLYKKENW